jgi:hypothetical protein
MLPLAVALVLSQAVIRPPAKEIQGGVAIVEGGAVDLTPGDCLVPRDRCIDYTQQAEGCFAEREELRKRPPLPPVWAVVIAALLGIGAGVALASAINP